MCDELLVARISVCSSGLFSTFLFYSDRHNSSFISLFAIRFDLFRNSFIPFTSYSFFYCETLQICYSPSCSSFGFSLPPCFSATTLHFSWHLSISSSSLQCISHPPPVTLSPRCECIYNVEHIHVMLLSLPFFPSLPAQWVL